MLTCREFVEFLIDYRDGLLSEPRRLQFDSHHGECADCVAYQATYERTIRLAKEACTSGDEPIPTDVPEDLVTAVLAACRR